MQRSPLHLAPLLCKLAFFLMIPTGYNPNSDQPIPNTRNPTHPKSTQNSNSFDPFINSFRLNGKRKKSHGNNAKKEKNRSNTAREPMQDSPWTIGRSK
jgi:hypothetical protein